MNSAPASQSAGIGLFADAKTAGQLLKITFWITKPDKTPATKDGKFNSSSGKFHIRVASKAVTPSITSATFTVNGASISGYKFPLEQASSAQKVEIYYDTGTANTATCAVSALEVDTSKAIDPTNVKYEPKTGAAMKLEVGPSERSSELLALPSESGYENADKVTFSLTLTQVKGSDTTTLRSLSVPVLITLPVPENISMKNVLVLHYSARGVYDKKLTAASITNSSRTITFAAPIAWAQQNGILGGYAGGTFRPDNSTTRQALWMVLARMSGASPAGLSGYSDTSAVANYAREALAWGVANGIITGTNDGRLNPQGTATRAHFAAFLYRYASL